MAATFCPPDCQSCTGEVGLHSGCKHPCLWKDQHRENQLLQGKKLIFVTNNSTKSRKGYLGKFTGLGLNISAEEIYSSSYAAAAYLESIDFPKDKKVQKHASHS